MGLSAGDLLPLALGIAASPFPIIPVILLLTGARPRATSGAFLAAWFVGIGVPTAIFAVVADLVDRSEAHNPWVSWARLALGLALIVLGLWKWLRRKESGPPSWLASVEQSTPAAAARLALLLSVANPKILLFSAAAGVTIGSAQAPATATILLIVAFSALASVTVALPVLGYLVLGARALAPLATARAWLTVHSAALMALVIVAIGAMLVGEGLAGL